MHLFFYTFFEKIENTEAVVSAKFKTKPVYIEDLFLFCKLLGVFASKFSKRDNKVRSKSFINRSVRVVKNADFSLLQNRVQNCQKFTQKGKSHNFNIAIKLYI